METKSAYRLSAAIMVISTIVIFVMTLRIQMLEDEREELHRQLHEAQEAPDRCTPVQVTCECPEYDEGWEDAQFAEGCDTTFDEIALEDLQRMCSDLETFDYVPGC